MKSAETSQTSPSGEERIMKIILLRPQPRSKVPAKLSGRGRFRCRKRKFEVVDGGL